MGQDFKGKNIAEIAGDLLLERKKLVGDAAAERKGHPTGADELKRSEEQEAFWKSFTTPEDDAKIWAEGLAAGKDAATIKQEVSTKKYQRRWELWSKQPDLPSKLKWAKEMQKLGPPAGMEPEPMTGPEAVAPAPVASPLSAETSPAMGRSLAGLGALGMGAAASGPVMAPPGMAPPGMVPPGMAPPGMAPPGMAPPGMAAPTLADLLGETSPPPLGIPLPPRY